MKHTSYFFKRLGRFSDCDSPLPLSHLWCLNAPPPSHMFVVCMLQGVQNSIRDAQRNSGCTVSNPGCPEQFGMLQIQSAMLGMHILPFRRLRVQYRVLRMPRIRCRVLRAFGLHCRPILDGPELTGNT